MVATETAKTVLLILFGLSILWIVVIIVRNDMETIIRALVVAAVLGLALYIIHIPRIARHDKISFAIIKNELLPARSRAFTFERREGRIDGHSTTTFIFSDPGPTLSVALVNGGKYIAINDVHSVNVVLQSLSLPPVVGGVPELAAITGKGSDSDKFRWDDYEKGILLIERGVCRDMTSASTFTCIARITLTAR
jgi:hypothetical protein